MIPKCISPRETPIEHSVVVDVTSRGAIKTYSNLSPFFVNGGRTFDGREYSNVENLWQYHKVYPHLGHWDEDAKQPTQTWWNWRNEGIKASRGVRYPAGHPKKDKTYQHPIGSWWNNILIGYTEARKSIYYPYYRYAIKEMPEYKQLVELSKLLESCKIQLYIKDFDVFDHYDGQDKEESLNELRKIINNPDKKFGHGFVILSMLLKEEN